MAKLNNSQRTLDCSSRMQLNMVGHRILKPFGKMFLSQMAFQKSLTMQIVATVMINLSDVLGIDIVEDLEINSEFSDTT